MLPSRLDLVNGLFEGFGGTFVWMNVRQILRDKQVRGVSKLATCFFTLWGLWNMVYYPSLGQWISFWGGCVISVGNGVWISLMWRYRKS